MSSQSFWSVIPRLGSWKLCLRASVFLFWVYFIVSLLSFHPLDSSYFSVSYPIRDTMNYGGVLGAWLASWVVYTTGFSIFLFLLAIPGMMIRKYRKISITFYLSVPFVFMFITSLFQFSFLYRGYPILLGGVYGYEASKNLVHILGFFGFWIFNMTIFILPWIFCYKNNLKKILIKTFQFSTRRPHLLQKSSTVPTENIVQPYSKDDYWSGPRQMLKKSETTSVQNRSELEQTSQKIVEILKDFNIEGEVIGYECGPVVATYHFQLAPGIRQAKVQTISDDLALCLRVESVFISALAEKKSIGIQVPHQQRELVCLGDLLDIADFDHGSPLLVCLGRAASGKPVTVDLAEMPHLLIAGATGSGKSVGINTLLISLLMRASPEDLQMILIDPKQLELAMYEGIPHLLMPVLTDPQKATVALRWVVKEMERRYSVLQQAGVRNIQSFKTNPTESMPYLLVVIDELADLMLTASADIELLIQRLAQKARACGIHMVLATQRPSVDVITGVIKANLPSRIAYQVFSRHDSRTILDQIGAENLLGKGDLLLMTPGKKNPERIQSAFVSDEEVLKVIGELKTSEMKAESEALQWIEKYEDQSGKKSKSKLNSADIE